jgi:hypothetical protein
MPPARERWLLRASLQVFCMVSHGDATCLVEARAMRITDSTIHDGDRGRNDCAVRRRHRAARLAVTGVQVGRARELS